jgi:hypothetical protein
MTDFYRALVTVTAEEYYYDEIGRYGRRPYLVENWCRENGIQAVRYSTGREWDEWTVPDEQQRVLFALRWS